MANFACEHCERTYVHRRNLTQHIKNKHPDAVRPVETKVRAEKKLKTGLAFKCDQCDRIYMHRKNLNRHVTRNHVDNPVFSCTHCGESYAVDTVDAVDMQESDHLSALQGAVTSFQHSMSKYHRDHKAYKFQLAADVIFHKAVDPAVITEPPVTLASEKVAVYAGDALPLEDIIGQQINLVEIYEHNGSGWVFSHFSSVHSGILILFVRVLLFHCHVGLETK